MDPGCAVIATNAVNMQNISGQCCINFISYDANALAKFIDKTMQDELLTFELRTGARPLALKDIGVDSLCSFF